METENRHKESTASGTPYDKARRIIDGGKEVPKNKASVAVG